MRSKVSFARALLRMTAGRVTDSWNKRAFAPNGKLRVLLIYDDHKLARTQFEAFHRYRSRFSRSGIDFRRVSYGAMAQGHQTPDANCIFLQSSYEPKAGELESVLDQLRIRHPAAPISYFDWFAPLDIRMAERVDPFVTYYVKKALLRERSHYLAPLNGHSNLTDYYALHFGTKNPAATWSIPPSIIPKLVVGPAFSTGAGLIEMFGRGMPIHSHSRPIDIHARIAVNGTPWYSLMRHQAADAVAAIKDLKIAHLGSVPRKRYLRELSQSKIVFSPFGYGEICWRDFEAVANGAVLIKPDMSHVDANPNIYIPGETYVPIKWDFSDFEQQVRSLLADPVRMRRIATQAFQVAHTHLHGEALENLVWLLASPEERLAAKRMAA